MKLVSNMDFRETPAACHIMAALTNLLVLFASPAVANEVDVQTAESLLDAALDCPVPAYTQGFDKVLDQNTYAGGGDQSLSVGIWRRHADGYPPRTWGEMLIAKVDYSSLSAPKMSENVVTLECLPWKPQCFEVSVKKDGTADDVMQSYNSFSVRICDRDTAGNFAAAVQAMAAAAVAQSVPAPTPAPAASPAPVFPSAPVAGASAKASNAKSDGWDEQLLFDPQSVGGHD